MTDFKSIQKESQVQVSLVINIEDDDHRIQLWKGASGGPYIYIEDLVKRAGIARLLFNTNGEIVFQELPDCLVPDIYWERVNEYDQLFNVQSTS